MGQGGARPKIYRARTFLQLSPPKYEFWAAKNGTCLPFSFFFLDIRIRTIQLKHEGWGAFFWTTASQDNFVGFNPLTILSGQGHISELIHSTLTFQMTGAANPLKTLPKAQRTRGLSSSYQSNFLVLGSYHKFKHKS